MDSDQSQEIVNIWKTHARQLAGGRSFSVSPASRDRLMLMCDLSNDYYDLQLEGWKMSMVYDLSEDTFKVTVWSGEHGFTSGMVPYEDPENIGTEMDAILSHMRAVANADRYQSWDRKGRKRAPLIRLRLPWRINKKGKRRFL